MRLVASLFARSIYLLEACWNFSPFCNVSDKRNSRVYIPEKSDRQVPTHKSGASIETSETDCSTELFVQNAKTLPRTLHTHDRTPTRSPIIMAKLGEGDERWIVQERTDGTNVHGIYLLALNLPRHFGFWNLIDMKGRSGNASPRGKP